VDVLQLLAPDQEPSWQHGDGPGPAAVAWCECSIGGYEIVLCRWDFSVAGGSFGVRDASGFCAAAAQAVARHRPLVCVTASGGTRLTEGIPALVGMARVTLARNSLAQAGVPLIAICDQPTTGGVWVTVASPADVRCAVSGATVGFAGPRVVQALVGTLPEGSHTAETAAAHGLVDAVLPADSVYSWLLRLLRLVPVPGPTPGPDVHLPQPVLEEPVDGWEQVQRSRSSARPGGEALLGQLLSGAVSLAAPRGDRTAVASVGLLGDLPVVAVALASRRGGRPTPDAFRLLVRAAQVAGRWGLPLLTLVDTPGAEPTASAENDGLARAIAETFDAVLTCPSPTLGVLLGEGGSGGALAALVCDRVLATPDSYFAALVPEGAAAALRLQPSAAARRLRLSPAEVRSDGVVDAMVPTAGTPGFASAVASALASVRTQPACERLAARELRWSSPAG
jgi:acetyl-CoA carboxylase alpha subunit